MKLNAELVRIIRDPEINRTFIELGIDPLGTSPEVFGKNLQADIARSRDMLRRRNIRAE